ncbi:hypothetical protein VPH35_132362 [Triticum aestivum]
MDWSGSTLLAPAKPQHRMQVVVRPVAVVVDLPARIQSDVCRARRLHSGSPMPLIQCDDYTRTVLRLNSGMPKHPGWVFLKCENDGEDGCLFWFWEGEYTDLLIERNLIHVHALLSRTKTNGAAAYAIREETRGEAMSTSLEPKKKNEECKIKNPQINNEYMKKILVQLVRAVMEVGYLLKCIIMVLIFFDLTILAKI